MSKPFVKGDPRINRAGRSRAVSDKEIAKARKELLAIFLDNQEQLRETLDELKPADFVNAILAIGKMVIPVPKPFDFEEPAVVKRIQTMTDDELNVLINEILKHHNNGSNVTAA